MYNKFLLAGKKKDFHRFPPDWRWSLRVPGWALAAGARAHEPRQLPSCEGAFQPRRPFQCPHHPPCLHTRMFTHTRTHRGSQEGTGKGGRSPLLSPLRVMSLFTYKFVKKVNRLSTAECILILLIQHNKIVPKKIGILV